MIPVGGHRARRGSTCEDAGMKEGRRGKKGKKKVVLLRTVPIASYCLLEMTMTAGYNQFFVLLIRTMAYCDNASHTMSQWSALLAASPAPRLPLLRTHWQTLCLA